MLELIFSLVILGVILYFLMQIPMDPAIAQLIRAVVIVCVVFILIRFILGIAPASISRWPF